MSRDDVETAYFTLLRAREELSELRRYQDYLTAEAQRLRRGVGEAAALRDQVPRRQLRGLQHTDPALDEAINARLAVIADEAARLPDRIAAAEDFVAECERDHAEQRARG